MPDSRKGPIPLIAVALIVVGGMLLLDRLNVVRIEYDMVFWFLVMLVGLMRVVQGFSRDRRGRIFAGTVLFLYGLFFLLRSSDYVDVRMRMFIPATFLVFGIALLMMFLNNYREWELLIPSFLFCGIGIAFVLSELGYLDSYEVWDVVHLYWPLGLVVVGLALLLRRRTQIQ